MGKSWKTAGKVEKAQQKGQIFTKLAREIQVAAKAGGPDPAANARLRLAIDAAKKVSCPNDTIDRAIKKGAGLLDDGKIIEELMYEGYGPHGVGVIVECQTDNKHRTAPEMRHAFKSHEGNMGESGSVAWMFERVGLLEGTKPGTFDPDEEAIEAGANEVSKGEDNTYEFFTGAEDLDAVRDALVKRGWKIETSELSYKAKNITELSDEQKKDVEEFLNYLDDMDDTHRVHATI
ncbi:YebC/PmpR family DNA-binding transcriptional regulator [Bdellovibrio svalbardensis]|uniref:Probable transcriptional regulatory protein NWE73_09725 n=1 Tax=Bdellovibrio svalbardensis TaxID=2972972 RepID=A0ABT6DIM6_9BACT|nr:YebC/PmpR family DNA-binding transcriptional regulator [Bdellovibrio svalbardensis]MDG0816643.1 YebC/PmpR family DNA-binding transcriptional regulator [Bdellovibrio svalbardensis]